MDQWPLCLVFRAVRMDQWPLKLVRGVPRDWHWSMDDSSQENNQGRKCAINKFWTKKTGGAVRVRV